MLASVTRARVSHATTGVQASFTPVSTSQDLREQAERDRCTSASKWSVSLPLHRHPPACTSSWSMDQGYCYPHRCERDSMGQPYPDCSPGGDGQLLYERGGCVLPGADPCASSRSLCSSGEERKFKDLSAPVRGKEESDMKYPLDGRGGHPGCDSMGGGRYGHLQYDQLHPGWPGSPYPGLHPAIVCKQEEG